MDELLNILRTQAKTTYALIKRIENYEKSRADSTISAYQLDGLIAEIMKLGENLPESKARQMLFEWLEAEEISVNKSKEEFRFHFSRELKELLAKQNIELKGQQPTLRAGLFTIKIDFEIGSATIYWGPEVEKVKSRVSLSTTEINKIIEELTKKLKAKTFNAEKFLSLIYQAYKRILIFNNRPSGEKVYILDLVNELVLLTQSTDFKADPTKEKFREYSRINFSFDLFQLRQHGADLKIENQKLHLYVATFDATLEKHKSLWVPDNEQGEGTHYSYLSFVS